VRRRPPPNGYRGRPYIQISDHALERVREHWPDAAHLYDSELRFLIGDQVADALSKNDFIVAPGGTYAPISVFGGDGYAVLIEGKVKTVMPVAWCAAVDKTRKRNAT
jgi:hypothetical protein